MKHAESEAELNLGRIGVSHHLENFVSGGAGAGYWNIVKNTKNASKMEFHEFSG